jgi:hypothetical protein
MLRGSWLTFHLIWTLAIDVPPHAFQWLKSTCGETFQNFEAGLRLLPYTRPLILGMPAPWGFTLHKNCHHLNFLKMAVGTCNIHKASVSSDCISIDMLYWTQLADQQENHWSASKALSNVTICRHIALCVNSDNWHWWCFALGTKE